MSPELAPESIRSAACALEGAPVVVGVSVHEPEQGPRQRWTIEATIVDDDGASPQLFEGAWCCRRSRVLDRRR